MTEHMEDAEDDGEIDRLLVKLMPNLTVIRRIVAACFILIVVACSSLLFVISHVRDNANRSAQAICLISQFANDAAQQSPTAEGRARLARLANGTRVLVRTCTPPEPAPPPSR